MITKSLLLHKQSIVCRDVSVKSLKLRREVATLELFIMNTSFSNELEYLFDSVPLWWKICHGIGFLASEASTFFCYSGFIHYEYNGGDPAKRSLKNKLFAQLCYTVLVLGTISSPAYAWRILVSPLTESLAIWILCVSFFIAIYYDQQRQTHKNVLRKSGWN